MIKKNLSTGKLRVAFAVVFLFSVWGCKRNVYTVIYGSTSQYESYTVVYSGNRNFKQEIDSLLRATEAQLSYSAQTSETSAFNNGTLHKFSSKKFYSLVKTTFSVAEITGGAYDPTLTPNIIHLLLLENAEARRRDSAFRAIDYKNVFFDDLSICKLEPDAKISFEPVMAAYQVDRIKDYLTDNGVKNFSINLGDITYGRGMAKNGKSWKVPDKNAAVPLVNQCVVIKSPDTETINPVSGEPVQNNLQSIITIAQDCVTADAFSEAFMVLGAEESMRIVRSRQDPKAVFRYYDSTTNTVKITASEQLKVYVR